MTTPEPYRVVLEFSRAHRAGQPHAFEFVPQTYLLRGPGGGFESAEFPWTPELLADLRAARIPGHTADAIHRVGDTLRNFLAGAGWTHHEHAIVRAAREGAPIVVTIRSAAAELYALPWEFVALKSTGQLIGGIPGLLVRYEWPEAPTFPDRVAPAARRGRVLLAWSAAGGAVPADRHVAALRDAFAARPDAFDPARDVIAHASFAAIDQALDDAARSGPPVDAIHLLCHGAAAGATYGLALDDEATPGAPVVVDAGRVQQLLAPHAGMLRMVVLAACDSGNTGELGNHLGSVAQMIHRAGLQAVVASRFPLSTAGSTHFAHAFYGALVSDHASLEQAFLAARDDLLRDPGQLDWASVQLYAREADGAALHPLHLESGGLPVPKTIPEQPPPAPPLPPVPSRRWPLAAALGLGVSAAAVAFVLTRPDDEAPAPKYSSADSGPEPVNPGLYIIPDPGSTERMLSPTPPRPDADEPPDPAAQPTPSPEPAILPDDPTTPLGRDAADPGKKNPGKKNPDKKNPDKKSVDADPYRFALCSPRVVALLGQHLPQSGTGDASINIEVRIQADGQLQVAHRSGNRSLLIPASDKLKAISADELISTANGKLPCKTRVDWIP
jgi:hypothetical protein